MIRKRAPTLARQSPFSCHPLSRAFLLYLPALRGKPRRFKPASKLNLMYKTGAGRNRKEIRPIAITPGVIVNRFNLLSTNTLCDISIIILFCQGFLREHPPGEFRAGAYRSHDGATGWFAAAGFGVGHPGRPRYQVRSFLPEPCSRPGNCPGVWHRHPW